MTAIETLQEKCQRLRQSSRRGNGSPGRGFDKFMPADWTAEEITKTGQATRDAMQTIIEELKAVTQAAKSESDPSPP